MGKCKKRTFYNNSTNEDFSMFCSTRQEAINNIINLLCETKIPNGKKAQKKQQNYKNAVSMISMFGISGEELSEAGASYEDLLGLGNLID